MIQNGIASFACRFLPKFDTFAPALVQTVRNIRKHADSADSNLFMIGNFLEWASVSASSNA
jgi:hypothetical protein